MCDIGGSVQVFYLLLMDIHYFDTRIFRLEKQSRFWIAVIWIYLHSAIAVDDSLMKGEKQVSKVLSDIEPMYALGRAKQISHMPTGELPNKVKIF